MKYLLIVEGEKAEPRIFENILSRYGFKVERLKRPKTFVGYSFALEETVVENGVDTVYIMQSPKNRIGEFIHTCIEENWDLHQAFHQDNGLFNGIFIIFDVDHTSSESLDCMMKRFSDEFDEGLLLVSSPCLEIISEPNRIAPIEVCHLSEYKRERNKELHGNPGIKKGTIDYIINNFEDLLISFLDRNQKDFKENNIMEHPVRAVQKINKHNTRCEDKVYYTYFTTVIYVAIACFMGLTRDIDNAEAVKKFLSERKAIQSISGKKRVQR